MRKFIFSLRSKIGRQARASYNPFLRLLCAVSVLVLIILLMTYFIALSFVCLALTASGIYKPAMAKCTTLLHSLAILRVTNIYATEDIVAEQPETITRGIERLSKGGARFIIEGTKIAGAKPGFYCVDWDKANVSMTDIHPWQMADMLRQIVERGFQIEKVYAVSTEPNKMAWWLPESFQK